MEFVLEAPIDTSIASLIAVRNLPGYKCIMEIFLIQIERLEREVFKVNPKDTDEVLAAQRVAVGARWAYEEANKAIDLLIRQAQLAEAPPLTREQEDEIHMKGLGVEQNGGSKPA